jgi:hypothetical protein
MPPVLGACSSRSYWIIEVKKAAAAGRFWYACSALKRRTDTELNLMKSLLKRRTFLAPLLLTGLARCITPTSRGAEEPKTSSQEGKASVGAVGGGEFSGVATEALAAMTKRAQDLRIKGVALVAYCEGDPVTAWSSKMTVVGSMKNAPSEKDRGANLLGIAYAKAAEMAESLKDSGTAGRPPMTGELGWRGGVIAKGKTGYIIAAFSGGPADDDVRVSRTGLEILARSL